MKKVAVFVVTFVFVLTAFAPTSSGLEAKPVFKGEGAARALDLSLPILNALPALGQDFKGLTLGLTSSTFSSDPKANGIAIGSCGLLQSGLSLPNLPAQLPCSNDSVESSAAPDGNAGDGNATCASALKLAIVNLVTSCANSLSKIEGGRPVSLNNGGVADLNLDLADLSNLLGLNVQDTTNQVVNTVTGLLTNVLGTVQGVAPVAPADLKGAVENFLEQIKDVNVAKLATIKAGLASTDVTNQGQITNVVSQAAGAKIGLLGITNALEDGLVIVDVSAAKAIANWNDVTGIAEASATPALATIRVKDLLNLVPGDYLQSTVDASALNSLLQPLAGTILDSSIELASATPPQKGSNVVASTSGVGLRLLRGVGESSAGARDGGIVLRVAAADVKLAGDIMKAIPAKPALPVTGGPTYVFLVGAAMLGAAAPFLARLGRRLRQAA